MYKPHRTERNREEKTYQETESKENKGIKKLDNDHVDKEKRNETLKIFVCNCVLLTDGVD